MKKLIVLGIIATMVMGMAVAASAAIDNAWVVQMRAETVPEVGIGQSGGNITLGTKVGAHDEYTIASGEDSVIKAPTGVKGTIYSDIMDLCAKDYRAPLQAGETKTWTLLVGINDVTSGPVKVSAWVAANTNVIDPSTDGDPDLLVQLFKDGVLLWTAPQNINGSQAEPQFAQEFQFENNTPFTLQLVASAIPEAPIPEPGSMVALFSGLVGLVGFGIRRRK